MRNLVIALFVGVTAACSMQASQDPGGGAPTPPAGEKVPAVKGTGPDPGTPAMVPPTPQGTKVRFGVAPQYSQSYAPPTSGPANVDAVAVGDWLIENGFTATHKTKLGQILAAKKTPYVFGYILTCDDEAGARRLRRLRR